MAPPGHASPLEGLLDVRPGLIQLSRLAFRQLGRAAAGLAAAARTPLYSAAGSKLLLRVHLHSYLQAVHAEAFAHAG